MKKWSRLSMSVVTLFMVLAISAMQVVPVLADDAAPPPPEVTEVAPPVEESTPEAPPVEPAEVPVTDVEEVPPTEAAPVVTEEQAPVEETVVEVPVTEVTPAEAPVAEPETPAEVLAQLPDGTELVVLDESGEALSLVSEEAAEVFYTGDPMWCPLGVTPNASVGGCTTNYGSLQELVADVGVGFSPATNGVIWIQNVTFASGGSIIFDGNMVGPTSLAWDTWSNFSLTLKGGWSGTGTTITTTPSTIQDPLKITNWNGAITISDIVITNATGGAGVYALDVATTKNISLTNVDVVENSADAGGASLDNTAGTLGTVVINDSTFSGNTGTGLWVFSNGTITAKNLTALDNTVGGAVLDNRWAPAAKAVTLTGSNNFSFNTGGDGLQVYARGAITLSNLNAMHNSGRGAYLDNCDFDGVDWCDNPFMSAVTLRGSSNFSGNGSHGLEVFGSSTITAANLTVDGNGGITENGYGVYLNNYGAHTAKLVSLTGVNSITNNTGTGLWLEAWGAVTLNSLTANSNGAGANCTTDCDGVHLEYAFGNFLLAGYGVFNGNAEDGLDLYYNDGVVTLNNLTASLNGGSGVYVDNVFVPRAVTLLGTNIFNENGANGLSIYSSGLVTLNNITANGNDLNGAYVDNAWKWVYNATLASWVRVTTGQSVFLKGVNTFNDNLGTGLEVHSSGIITTYGITANSNEGDGAYLDNCLYDPPPLGIDDCLGLAGKAVTMLGNNNFNDNLGTGLYVESLGAIKVNNLTSSYNGDGAVLDNNWTKAVGGVTITGFSTTNWNYSSGLGIYSVGAVLTNNLTANYNGAMRTSAADIYNRGVTINNSSNSQKLMNVTLLGVNQFNNNWNTGLQIWSNGIVLLNNLTANDNGTPYDAVNNPSAMGDGVAVNNAVSSQIKPVTLTGVNVFNGNLNNGLEIVSHGVILVSKPTANDNVGSGAYLDNQWGVAAAPITITGYGIFNANQNMYYDPIDNPNDLGGLVVFSNGNITLNNLTANDNAMGGAYLANNNWTPAAAPVNVTLNGVNQFNGNMASDGLTIFSDGMITLSNITASYNGGDGAYLDNFSDMKTGNPRSIIVKGWGTFVNNGLNGLEFYASGSVTLSRVTANGNQNLVPGTGNGVVGEAGTSITFTCGSLNLNVASGYDLTAGTFIVLKGVFTYSNGTGNVYNVPPTITRSCPLP